MQNRIVWIFWGLWSWKTLYSVILSSQYSRVFANFVIKWHQDAIFYKTVNDIEKIEKQKNKWLLIIDEANLNFSGRDSMSWKNKIIIKFVLLSRKKNLDLIIVWQEFSWIDKYGRNLCEIVYILKKVQKSTFFDVIMQICTKKWNINSWFMLTRLTYLIDPVTLLKKLNLKYDTTELSLI